MILFVLTYVLFFIKVLRIFCTSYLAEEKIMTDQALFEDIVLFQRMINSRVQQILASSPEELFTIETTPGQPRQQESTSRYLTCAVCGEQVLANRCIESRNKWYCLPCFQQQAPGCVHLGLQ